MHGMFIFVFFSFSFFVSFTRVYMIKEIAGCVKCFQQIKKHGISLSLCYLFFFLNVTGNARSCKIGGMGW